jgi:mannosyltransferase OCH1-like enzyme
LAPDDIGKTRLQDQLAASRAEVRIGMTIPRILHYVWVGGPLPAAQQEYIATWRATNPDFEVVCWNEQNIDMSPKILSDAYKNRKWAKVADIARLQGVLRMGGIYFDTDFKLFKPLTPLLDYTCFYAFQETNESADWVCNGVFGAEPGHWFVKEALEGLYAMKRNLFLPERPTAFGPKHITRLLRRHGLNRYSPGGVFVKDVYIAPTPVFFPFHFTEQFTPECVREETLAAHFWEKSWETSIPKPIRIAKKIIKTFSPGTGGVGHRA